MTTQTPPQAADAPLMLSVSGARGIVGRTMTPAVAADFAAAYGSHVKDLTGKADPLFCLGRDSRPSGQMLTAAVVAGLTAAGCRVVELGIVTTPTVGVMIGKHHADAGMVVTASHNPIIWNGLKCLDSNGLAPPPEIAQQIIERFKARDIGYAAVEDLHPAREDATGHETHIDRVLANIDPAPIRAAGFKVVLDSVNGAGCVAGRMLLEALGCEVIHLNGEPTGIFAHTPEPTAENLTDLCRAVKDARAACGFAQDPDGDRLAIVDETGAYIGEEYTLVLAAKRLLDQHGPAILAANLSTSRMIDDLAAQYPGSKVLRTAVGEANVAAAMQQAGALVGGEGNGGVIYPPVCWIRDSLTAMALTLSLLADDPRNESLSKIVGGVPRYSMIKKKLDLTNIGGRDAVPGILERLSTPKKASGSFFGEEVEVNTVDGVRIDFADGWVHVRPSNTEPILRLIAEAQTEKRAAELIDQVAEIAGIG
ncbi:MAG: phosphoglucosamine mutase [Phycisphaerales bacterium]|nr:MAG: phosphoglucosamine mutase [Phycisphaerales bacterium]